MTSFVRFAGRVFFVLALNVTSLLAVYSQEIKESVVSGSVSDILGAVVSNATLNFANLGKVYSTRTSHTGIYSIRLGAGVYEVTVDASAAGFEILRRSPIYIGSDSPQSRTLNLQVYGKFPIFGEAQNRPIAPVEHPFISYLAYTYEQIPGLSEIGLERATVSFGSKCEKKGSVVYSTSPFDPGTGATVTLTYDFLTVTAIELFFDKKKREFVAVGDVKIQIEQERRNLNGKVRLFVKDGKVQYSEIK